MESLPIYQINATSCNICALEVAKQENILNPTSPIHRHKSNGTLVMVSLNDDADVWISCLDVICMAELNKKSMMLSIRRLKALRAAGQAAVNADTGIRQSINGKRVWVKVTLAHFLTKAA